MQQDCWPAVLQSASWDNSDPEIGGWCLFDYCLTKTSFTEASKMKELRKQVFKGS